jgi:hypothetical protein
MKTKINFSIALMAISYLFLFSSCCTFIGGLVIGGNIDEHHRNNTTIEANQIHKIRQGRTVDINCNDTVTTGTYKGRIHLQQQEYAENYRKFKSLYPDDLSIPEIGDTIDIYNVKTGSIKRGKFIALETNRILMESLTSKGTIKVPLSLIDEQIYYNEKPFFIKNYADFPIITVIELKTRGKELLKFPVNGIDYITVHYSYSNKEFGLAVGFAMDVIIGLIIYNNVDFSSSSGGIF